MCGEIRIAVWNFFEDRPKKSVISAKIKNEVYKRAGGRCERSGLRLGKTYGHYHHLRKNSASANTVQFLCSNCHIFHGHEHKTRTNDYGLLGTEKERVIMRERVKHIRGKNPKKPSSKQESRKTKPITIKKTTLKKSSVDRKQAKK